MTDRIKRALRWVFRWAFQKPWGWAVRACRWAWKLVHTRFMQFCSMVSVLGVSFMALFIFMVTYHEHRLGVLAWKVTTIMAGGLVGWAADFVLFSKGGQLDDQDSETARAAVMIRRGIVVGIGMLSCSLAI